MEEEDETAKAILGMINRGGLPVEEEEDGEGSLKTDARHICPRHTSCLISAMSSFDYDDDEQMVILLIFGLPLTLPEAKQTQAKLLLTK